MAGIGVKRHIGHDAQAWKMFFKGGHHVGYQAFGVGGFFAIGCFEVGTDYGEKRHHRNTKLYAFFGHRQE